MIVEVFIKPDGDLYRAGFTIGVQTFYLEMGSEGLRPKEEAEFYRRNLIAAFTKLILQEREQGVNDSIYGQRAKDEH